MWSHLPVHNLIWLQRIAALKKMGQEARPPGRARRPVREVPGRRQRGRSVAGVGLAGMRRLNRKAGSAMTDKYFLAKGKHDRPENGLCAMEWVSYIAGERHSDQPVCVSPILQGFCISVNDAWDDEMRQRLRPYLARCIGTAGDGLDEQRGFLCLDWHIRICLPAWLEVAGLYGEATRVRALAPITNLRTAEAAGSVVREAREKAAAAARAAAWNATVAAAGDAAWNATGAAAVAAAGDAAWDATGAAAVAAAGDATRDATRAAARDAAWAATRAAAGDAARAAAGDAAWAAARAAAWAAARDALEPTVRELQESVLDLLDRMLPKVTVELPAPVAARAVEVCGMDA
jgi:hypothetical protein